MRLPSERLSGQAQSLSEGGDWTALYELLRSEPAQTVATDAELAYRWGEALYHTGRMDELARYAEIYESAARAASDSKGIMKALNLGGIAAFELGRTGEAQARFDHLMELSEAEGDRDMLARAANNLGALANLRGLWHEAIALYSLAIPLYQKLGQLRGLAQSHHNLAMSYRDLDRFDDAIEQYKQAVHLAYRISYSPLVAMATTGRAESELLRGDLDLSRELVMRGLTIARDVGDPISEAEALRVYGLTVAARGDAPEQARSEFRAALKLARETGNALLQAEIERDLGRFERTEERPTEAERLLESARKRFLAIGATAEARQVSEELDALR